MVDGQQPSIEGNFLKVNIDGYLDVKEKDILHYHPNVKPLLDEITSKGWKYDFGSVKAKVSIALDLENSYFNLEADSEPEENKEDYLLRVSLRDEPEIVKVLAVESFHVQIGAPNSYRAVTVDPLSHLVTDIYDVWFPFNDSEGPKKLGEAREIYEVAKWLVREKGFSIEGDEMEDYTKLVNLFEKRQSFPLELELTVEDEQKVPGREELVNGLSKYLRERGLLVNVKKPDKSEESPLL